MKEETQEAVQPPTRHFTHAIHLDKWRLRSVKVIAPAVVTKAEMERIKGWISTLVIIED